MVVSATSRFQPVDVAIKAPGESLITKRTDGPFIDTQISFGLSDRPFFRGRVYLHKDEVREMAEQLGLFDEVRAEADESHRMFVLKLQEEALGQASQSGFDVGYAAGRAENLDHLADELVDRMRARVARSGKRVDVPAAAGGDDQAAEPSAEPVADAPVVEDADGVRSADGGSEPRA